MARRMRGISHIVAVVAVTIAALAGAYLLFTLMQGQVAAYARGSLAVEVKPVTTDTTTYLSITIRNTGGSSIEIQQVFVDNTNISQQLGLPVTLGPGDVLQKVVDLNQILSGGKHTVKVVYVEGGKTKEDIYSFVV